jgi:hypothetical protein
MKNPLRTCLPRPDYVFHATYRLRPLWEVEQFVQDNGHLPEVLSAAAVEELTLYLLELKKENEVLQARVSKLEH